MPHKQHVLSVQLYFSIKKKFNFCELKVKAENVSQRINQLKPKTKSHTTNITKP